MTYIGMYITFVYTVRYLGVMFNNIMIKGGTSMSNTLITNERYLKLKSLAEKILECNLGKKREFIEIKNNNWTFITDDNKTPYMVKFVSEEEQTRLKTEIAINEFLKEKIALPMPDIVAHGKEEGEYYLLRNIIAGKSMSEEIEESNNVEDLFYEVGEILAKIHSIEFDTKGIINSEIKIEQYNIFSQEEFNGFLDILINKGIISKEENNYLWNIDVDYYYNKKPYVLCHCDFTPGNIIVNNKKVAAIIDFEFASACPFMDDLAGFELFTYLDGYSKYIESFYKGYSNVRDIPDYYFKNLDFYKFYRLLTTLSYLVNSVDETVNIELKNRLKEELSSYLKKAKTFNRK